jgi:hypothetical protein
MLLPVTYTQAQIHTYTRAGTKPDPMPNGEFKDYVGQMRRETNVTLTESCNVIVRPPELLFGMG